MPKEKTLINFKKAHSLIAKMIQMAENDEYCIDIMQQNLAAIGLLRSAHQSLMENHLNSCFMAAMETGSRKTKEKMIGEIMQVNKLYNK